MEVFVNILVNISNDEVDNLYTYKIYKPDYIKNEDDLIGYRVMVPFGRSNKNIEGFIISLAKEIHYDKSKIKKVSFLPETYPMFTKWQIDLAIWMSKEYFCRLIECIKTIKPSGKKISTKYVFYIKNKIEKLTAKENELYEYIKKYEKVTDTEILENFSKGILDNLLKKEAIGRQQISKVQDLTLRVRVVSLLQHKKNEIKLIKEKKNKQSKVIEFIEKYDNGENEMEVNYSDIKDYLGISNSPIDTLEKNGIIEYKTKIIKRNSVIKYQVKNKNNNLTMEQKNALAGIIEEKEKTILLHGVTGSGKTEVYMHAIEEFISMGKSAIVLVPEISLTPQTVSNFTNRFGDKVAFTHSRLSIGERHDVWQKVRDKDVSIVIGPRSAVFMPMDNLGIVIIDEEHESSFKSDTTPKYETDEVARKICDLVGATLVLGSATPKINTYNKVGSKIKLIEMNSRVNNSFPEIEVEDMRLELAKGNRSIFSEKLLKSMVETLNDNKQIILFLNKRGFSKFVSCRTCGYVMECDNCSVSYTYHKYNNSLKCHYCNKEINMATNCPVCGSKYLREFGVGTQKIEEELKKIFPNEKILRMDLDTTSKKNSHENILEKFRSMESRILIGTQMIAKGLDFPSVTLVGVIAADLSLNNGDYRSGEITYQLLSQVAGRAGRSQHKGRVIIQTYNPNHYAIVCAKNNDYDGFYKEEIALRRQMNYPPFTNIFVVTFISDDERDLIVKLNRLLYYMNYYNKKGFFEMLGPTPCNVFRVNNKYRWRIIVRGESRELLIMFNMHCLKAFKKQEEHSKIDINLNINPTVIF
ncbi:MAG: primosomal protein N' [Lachnospirales bacterium]